MSNPTGDTQSFEAAVEAILWPHPFNGQAAKPNQVAISNGLPPDGKAFAMSYSMAVKALTAAHTAAIKAKLEALLAGSHGTYINYGTYINVEPIQHLIAELTNPQEGR